MVSEVSICILYTSERSTLMNSKQLQYAIKLSKVLNFSQVADQLNISQPALSKQILNLENELGVKLFDRSKNPMQLTPAGEYFIREAQDLLYKEDQLLRSIGRFKSGESGRLDIGITPFRSSYLIPNIVKQIHNRYPGILVRLHEANSDILRKEAAEGAYDFAIVNLPVDDSIFHITPLEPDQLVLAVPQDLIHLLPSCCHDEQVEFCQCSELPFVVVGQNQEMRKLFDHLCSSAGFQPTIVAEAVSLTTAWALARAGVAAVILPMQFVGQENSDDILRIYHIKDAVYTRQPVIVTRREQYISNCAQYAIQLLVGEKTDQVSE